VTAHAPGGFGGCNDPSCLACQLFRSFGQPRAENAASSFARLSEQIESVLREDERTILLKDATVSTLRRIRKDDDAAKKREECRGLDLLCIAIAEDEVTFRRARVTKFRALLAEEIGRRVVATAPKASEVSK
jgi:hypothetical protein